MIDRWRSDADFAVDLRARDSDAWALAYVRFVAPMRSVARRFGPLGQADDVVHEVFAQFWDRPDHFDPERGSLRGYLLTMTRSRSIDVYRQDVARHRRETRDLEEGRSSPVASVEADAMAGITTAELVMVMRMLPRREREAIGLAFFRHLSYQQVAITLGVPEGTIKSRIRTGLLRMRTALGELGLVDDPLPGEIAPSGADPTPDC